MAAGLTWPRQAGAGGYRGAPGPAAWGGRGWGEPGGGGPRARLGARGSARGGEGVCLFGACSLRIFSASGLLTARCSFEGFFLFLNKCQRCRHGTFCSHHPEFFRWNGMGRTGRGRGGGGASHAGHASPAPRNNHARSSLRPSVPFPHFKKWEYIFLHRLPAPPSHAKGIIRRTIFCTVFWAFFFTRSPWGPCHIRA